jgi:aryl-alcohol dehydrogenase-like predicted oxidoreductase
MGSCTDNWRTVTVATVEASLKRLKPERIDLYWAHVSDGVTLVGPCFDALDGSGKSLHRHF